MTTKIPMAIFEPIPSDWKRKPYFDYYYHTIKTKYNVNYHLDITALLRWYIIEAAWRAVRCDPAMTAAYEGYRLRMGANKAIVKIARKLVNRIFFVLKRKQAYVNGMVG